MSSMKNLLLGLCLLLLLISFQGCNDDFLSENTRNYYSLNDTIILDNSQNNVDVGFELPVKLNSAFTIYRQPRWLSFKSMHGTLEDGKGSLSFIILKDRIPTGYVTQYSSVVLNVEGLGMVELRLSYSNWGSPSLSFSASSVTFESSGDRILSIINGPYGILKWNITDIPEWLTVSPASGIIYYAGSASLQLSLNIELITPGQEYSGSIKINSNSPGGPVTIPVTIPSTAILATEVISMEGQVTDAKQRNEAGVVAVCTISPNSLVVINTNNGEKRVLPLDKSPSCLSISEDGSKAVIGYTVAAASLVDLRTLAVEKEYTIDCIPFDLVYGNNGWCYISPSTGQWVKLTNLNLSTSEIVNGTNSYTLYEKTTLRKIKGKTGMVGTRTTLSPTGILIFDLSRGVASDSISYYHTSLGRFWITQDGTKLFDSYKNVYNLPPFDGLFHPETPSQYGRIADNAYNVTAFDHNQATSRVFLSFSSNDYSSSFSSSIAGYDVTSLNKLANFYVTDYVLTENGSKTRYEAVVRYLFTNKDGTALFALKNMKETYNREYWALERFTIGK